MRRIYLSHFLGKDTPFYGGDGRFQAEVLRLIKAGDSCNSSRWSFPNHAGTHVDLPLHFFDDGSSMEKIPPDFWCFEKVGVVDISDVPPDSRIGIEFFESCDVISAVELLLVKTGFGRYRNTPVYWQQNPIFCPTIAEYLRGRFPSLRALGIDCISISSWRDRATGREAHRAFLGGNHPIFLLEDMDLAAANDSLTFSGVTAAPLLVEGADAAPCTVIAEVIE